MIRSDQSLSHVRLFATPWIVARQASLSITNLSENIGSNIFLLKTELQNEKKQLVYIKMPSLKKKNSLKSFESILIIQRIKVTALVLTHRLY